MSITAPSTTAQSAAATPTPESAAATATPAQSAPATPTTAGTPTSRTVAKTLIPVFDAWENDEELLLIADLPGVTADTLRVRFDDRSLLIEADTTDHARYRRSFTFKRPIDVDNIRAELKDGVLRVHLPRTAAARSRTIEIIEA